jgi:predicted phosphodiesterase
VKTALISDIHANLEALQAVLEAVDREHPGAAMLCAGDIVGYGPDPGACIDLLRQREVPCIRGNHEEMVLGLRSFSRCVSAGISAARWTRRQLSPSQRQFLEGLPILKQISEELVMCHGDLLSADTYISDAASAQTALQQLQQMAPTARVLVCGHTHHASLYAAGQARFSTEVPECATLDPGLRQIINPGAVGQSRDGTPVARYAVLDLDTHSVSFCRLAYDHERTEHKMRQAGLRGGVVLLPPSGLGRRLERARTRWQKLLGDRENQRLGYRPTLHG